jgi:hypothetical protein
VTYEGVGVSGVVLTIVEADSGDVTAAVTDGSGAYAFEQLPDGSYRLEVETPDGMMLENGVKNFGFEMTDGEIRKDVEIRLVLVSE